MRQIKATAGYLFQSILYFISALCCTASCCTVTGTVTVSWHPKPKVGTKRLSLGTNRLGTKRLVSQLEIFPKIR